MELDFITLPIFPDEMGEAEYELHRAQIKTDLKAWTLHMVQVLKDSPSKECKFLRWKISDTQAYRGVPGCNYVVVEKGELEVLPEISL